MYKAKYQHTVKNAFQVSGIGVHSGLPANIKVKAAPASSGIVFVRTDVKDRDNVIPAKWDKVVDTKLCTVIGNPSGVTVATVEHLMSAFSVMAVDNAIVEIDGAEVPIMDGSAAPFIEAIKASGLAEQKTHRKAIRIKKTISFLDGDKEVLLMPSDKQKYTCEIEFANKTIGMQSFSYILDAHDYEETIAPARTFGLLHEVEYLRSLGLAKGGSLENAIVVSDEGVLNAGGLRFENEFVRHKVLDAIGDMYMTGMPILGEYVGIKAGHAMNNKALRELFLSPDSFEIIDFAPTKAVRSETKSLSSSIQPLSLVMA